MKPSLSCLTKTGRRSLKLVSSQFAKQWSAVSLLSPAFIILSPFRTTPRWEEAHSSRPLLPAKIGPEDKRRWWGRRVRKEGESIFWHTESPSRLHKTFLWSFSTAAGLTSVILIMNSAKDRLKGFYTIHTQNIKDRSSAAEMSPSSDVLAV